MASRRRTAPTAYEAALAALPTQYLECRRWGHAWTASTVGRKGRQIDESVVCMRCKINWGALLNQRGDVLKRKRHDYSEAEGYVLKGFGRYDKEARRLVRVELAGRLAA